MNAITAEMSPEIQIHRYASQLRLRIEKGEFAWNVACVNYGYCGSYETHYVVQDDYYGSPSGAEMDGVEFGMRICKSCIRRPEWQGANVLVRRVRVPLMKRTKCMTGNVDCQRHAGMFIVVGDDYDDRSARRHMCVNHIAIHATYRNVYRINKAGMVWDVTGMMLEYYQNHLRIDAQ